MLRQSVFRTAFATVRRQRYGAAVVLFACAVFVPPGITARAASIGVAPTLIDIKRGESVSGLRVRNGDAGKPVSVQVRVLRWHQDASGNVYEPAEGVVASPPVTRILPGAENLIRIVRTSGQPVAGEESYRLLVDELPDPDQPQTGVVSMLIRHSVPVFFSQPGAAPAQPQWRIAQAGKGVWRVTVANAGDKRLRLADLVLLDASGTRVAAQPGLVGYVLGRTSQNFVVRGEGDTAPSSPAALRISVQSEAASLETGLLPVVFP